VAGYHDLPADRDAYRIRPMLCGKNQARSGETIAVKSRRRLPTDAKFSQGQNKWHAVTFS
jgi:hypothetical protein